MDQNRMEGACSYSLNQVLADGVYDRIEIDAGGLFRIVGWLKGEARPDLIPEVYVDSHQVPFLQHYRVSRPDVIQAGVSFSSFQPGVILEYLLPERLCAQEFRSVSVVLRDVMNFRFESSLFFVSPDYRRLFDEEHVFRREEIYASGQPNSQVHPDVLALAKKLAPPILDFGCGTGSLLSALKAADMEAHGLELKNPPFLSCIQPELVRAVTFYNGRFPSPIGTGSFRSVFCSEVLEHIADYRGAIKDIARIASEKVIITVPDASGIPLGSRHRLLPWHLLEGTHVNFFNQTSLESALRPYFSQIDFGRICACKMNDTTFYVSLAAICRK
jgi:hypothetical protein